ncbi:endonuclease/exonuclease/phosphatase family protein [Candidatus Woesearchaeota archaeon]|nr:endonuclease/exonuclease/phosphatase family protein [Candidatus Woesearchaeota archaeon]
MTELSVLTWNMFWGLGAPKGVLDHARKSASYLRPDIEESSKAAAFIAGLEPDIVALQEVDGGSRRNLGADQVHEMAACANLSHTAFNPERSGLNMYDGNALLSRYRLPEQVFGALPYLVERRNYVLTFPDVGGRVAFISTHLGAHRLMVGERASQAEYLADVIKELNCPVVLMGDFNCTPDSNELRPLRHAGLAPLNYKATYPSYRPKHAFDNIMITGDVREIFSAVMPDRNSDHLAVYARLRI